MIQVTELALKEINKTSTSYKDEMEDQYIRLSMSVG
jgi:hypothetical protein